MIASVRPRTARLARVLSVLCLAAVTLPLTGCSRNPATGELVLTLYSASSMTALGEEAAPQFTEEFGGKVADESLQAYVTEVGQRLAAQTEADYPDYPWEFTLLDSDVVNAFALPGGKVFITRGLASRLSDESELAGVLGHEVGHVTAQHGNRRMSKQGLLAGGLVGVQAVLQSTPEDSNARSVGEVLVPAVQTGAGVLFLKYGRDEEIEADGLGVRYMGRAGYDPMGQARVMGVLASLGSRSGGVVESLLASHPDPALRKERVERSIAEGAGAGPRRGDGVFAGAYRQRMLDQLTQLPAARHSARLPLTEDELHMLDSALGAFCPLCIAIRATQ